MLYASRAVTVVLNAVPAMALPGAETVKWVAAPAPTAMVPDVPVMVSVIVSVALMVRLPVVCRVAEKLPVPVESVEFAGRTAAPSVLVKCTVPL